MQLMLTMPSLYVTVVLLIIASILYSQLQVSTSIYLPTVNNRLHCIFLSWHHNPLDTIQYKWNTDGAKVPIIVVKSETK